MAQISKDGDALVVALSPLEKFLGMRARVTVPLPAVQQVEVLTDPMQQVHGLRPSRMKLVGGYIPGRIAVGSFLNGRERPAYIVVRRSQPHGLRISLDGAKYSQLLVGVDDPEASKRSLLGAPT